MISHFWLDMTRNSENNSLTGNLNDNLQGSWVTLNHVGTAAGLALYEQTPPSLVTFPLDDLSSNLLQVVGKHEVRGDDKIASTFPASNLTNPAHVPVVSCLKKSGPFRASHPLLPPAPHPGGSDNVRVRGRRQVIVVRSAPRTPPNTPTVSEPAAPTNSRKSDWTTCDTLATTTPKRWLSVERMLVEAQKERQTSCSKSSFSSPIGSSYALDDPPGPDTGPEGTPLNTSAWSSPMYPASPYPEWRNDFKEELSNTDWIWDWSVRVSSEMHGDDLSDHLGSCVASSDKVKRSRLRNSSVMKSILLSPRIIPWLLFTNVFSLIIGAGIGLYFGIQWYTSPPSLALPYKRF